MTTVATAPKIAAPIITAESLSCSFRMLKGSR
jgi:hypothetical protein